MGSKLPLSAWDHSSFDHLPGGRNCYCLRFVSGKTDIWSLRSDTPDRNVPQRVWTTEITIAYMQSELPKIGARLLVNSPERDLQIEPAVPNFLQKIANGCGLQHHGQDISDIPWTIKSNDDAEALTNALVDHHRETPILVFTTPETGADTSQLKALDFLAKKTFGIASVVVIPAQFTWALTDRFGKRLSVFGGAARVYRPNFSEEANPYEHDLILTDRLSDQEKWDRELGSGLIYPTRK